MSEAYRLRSVDPIRASALARRIGASTTLGQILLHRGIEAPEAAFEFLNPRLRDLCDPSSMLDLERAVERIAAAIRRKERIVVFGDYDVDGTTSAAIMTLGIEAIGGEAKALVANRALGGYGLSAPALERCLESDPSLLITCDCGSSDHPRVADARARGVDVIVIDHHLVPEEELPAFAFLNPHQPNCGFPYKGFASAGLAFVVIARLRRLLNSNFDVRELLDLVALGTVADVAPLDGDNRRLVRAGLDRLRTSERPGLEALKKLANIRKGAFLGGRDIAFKLAPRLNAPGRIDDPDLTLKLLLERDPLRAKVYAEKIEALNRRRREIADGIMKDALERTRALYGERPRTGIVIDGEGYHPGVLGIIASRLADRFGVPAIVLGYEEGIAIGSGRRAGAFNIHGALLDCAEYLIGFGGHEAAVGVRLEPSRVDAFREAFAARSESLGTAPSPPLDVDIEVGGAFELPTVEELGALEPLGEANVSPIFALPAIVEEAKPVGEGGAHLKLRLKVGRRYISGFAANYSEVPPEPGASIRAVGELGRNTFYGRDQLEVSIERLISDP